MDLPPISIEFEAKIAKVMADMEILKRQIKSVGDVAARQKLMTAAEGFEKSLKSGAATSAVANMYKGIKKESEKGGQESARSFWDAFKKELKKEKNPGRIPGWLPWVGLAMPALPAAITGLTGSLGALATAGLGAAAGIGAIGISAAEVLAPVKQAFTTIDQLTTSNSIAANATALQTLIKNNAASQTSASKIIAATAGAGGTSGFTVADANARIKMLQGRIKNATTPSAAANYSAELAAAQRHLARLQGTATVGGAGGKLGPAASVLGPGLGFLANPNVNWYTMSAKQQRALVIAGQSTTGMPSYEKKQVEALLQERQAYSKLNKPQQKALFQYTKFDQTMVAAQQSSQPQVLKLWADGLAAITPALKYLHPLAVAATGPLDTIIKLFGQMIKSQGVATFVKNLERMSKVGISVFGKAFIDGMKGIMNIFDAFSRSPVIGIVTNDFLNMAKAFEKSTSSKTGGFATFMNEVKQNAPIIDNLLHNLVDILGHLITSMGSGFGTAELKGLNMFFTILNKVSGIPGLGPLVYNLTALVLITSKFGSFRVIGAAFDTMGKGLARMAAAKFGTIIAGMLGIETEGMAVGTMWKTIGKNALTFTKNLIVDLGKSLVSMTVWSAKMIIKGAVWVAKTIAQVAVTVAANIAGAAATAAAWVAANATMIIASGGIVLALGAIVIGIYFLWKHWHTVWGWIKKVAEDVWKFIWDGFGKYLLPLLGPAGLIALGAIELAKHWGTVCGDIKRVGKDLWHWFWNDFGKPIVDLFIHTLPKAFDQSVKAIGKAFSAVKDAVLSPIKWVVDHVLNGLIGAFDAISTRVGGPNIKAVHPMGLATGGRVAGYGGGDRHLALLEGGEAVIDKVTTARNAHTLRRWGVPGFAHGGKIGQNPPHGNPHLPQGQADPGGGIGGWIHGALHKAADIAKATAAIFTGNGTALGNAITDMIPGGVGGAIGDMAKLLTDMPKTLLKDAIKTLLASGGLGANASAIVKYAMSFIGRIPYVWGGTAVPGGADCSGFVQAIYRHFNINAPRTSEAQGQWVRRTAPTPGGLAFYNSPAGGPPPGHVAIVRDRKSVISQGGGMGPQVIPIHALPLMFTGIPPHGLGMGAAGGSAGAAQSYAQSQLASFGWGQRQMSPLRALWNRESNWNRFARNPSSGAYGIPQALPPTKMPFGAQAAGGSQTVPQVDWGMGYVSGRYGSPAGAWAHEQSFGWYGNGFHGTFNRPTVIGVGDGGSERVDITPMRHGRKPNMSSGTPIFIQVNTQEINPVYHAARLGFELARRAS
jgi:cell wall-associated NlpC family hydrolase